MSPRIELVIEERWGARRSRSASAGFTLIEALAALMLVAIVLPFALRALTASAQMGVYADRTAQAMELADTKLAEVIVTGEWEAGDSAGSFDPETYGDSADKYEWLVMVDDWNNAAFSQVTVMVSWKQSGQTQTVSLGTVVYAEEL